MLEILEFIFSDAIHFLGTFAMLLIIVWGLSNFAIVRIKKSDYHLLPNSFVDDSEDETED